MLSGEVFTDFGGDFRGYLQSGRTHRREMPSGRRRKGSGKADGCGRGPGLDRSDGSFRVLGVLFVLGDYRPFAGGRGGLSSLRSRVFDELYKRLRSHANICPVPMAESLRFYLRNREKGIDGKNIVMGLIADQNPPRRPDSHWFRFLNRDTIFFDGGEKLALRCGLPVYCCWLRRVKPGYYEMDFDRIYDGEEEVAPHEITERYVRRLEQKIREYPDLWMWSHKRWKHKSPADLARMECERKQK